MSGRTRRVRELEYHDDLLSDWGVQHLHLGTTYLPNGLIRGTREILYCVIEPDDVYFIQVMNHHSFSEPQLLEIVNSNWPTLLIRTPLYPGTIPTSSTVRAYREGKVQSLITLANGNVIAPRGGGYDSLGHSLKALRSERHWAWLANQWETIARDSVDALIEDAKTRNVPVPPVIRFVLWENDNVWHAVAPDLEAGVILPTE